MSNPKLVRVLALMTIAGWTASACRDHDAILEQQDITGRWTLVPVAGISMTANLIAAPPPPDLTVIDNRGPERKVTGTATFTSTQVPFATDPTCCIAYIYGKTYHELPVAFSIYFQTDTSAVAVAGYQATGGMIPGHCAIHLNGHRQSADTLMASVYTGTEGECPYLNPSLVPPDWVFVRAKE